MGKRAVVLIAAVTALLYGMQEEAAARKPVWSLVTWRTSASNSNGYVDSTVARGTVARLDTTAYVTMSAYDADPNVTSTAGDSCRYFVWSYIPSGSASYAFTTPSSVKLNIQVSENRTDWFDLADSVSITATSTRHYLRQFNVKRASCGIGTDTFGCWPFVRFIVSTDGKGEWVSYISAEAN